MEGINFLKDINNLYSSNTYLEKNGTSLVITVIIITIVFSIITYTEIQNNLKPIKKDWAEYRCHPTYIPIAGLINAPKGTSILDYTIDNFTFCIQNILSEIMEFIVVPIELLFSSMAKNISVMVDGSGSHKSGILKDITTFVKNIRQLLTEIIDQVYAKLYNIVISLLPMYLKIQDIINRIAGVFMNIVYLVESMVFLCFAWINLLLDTIIKLFLELFWELRTIILVCLIVFVVFMVVLFYDYIVMFVEGVLALVGFIMSLIPFPPVEIAGDVIEVTAEVAAEVTATEMSIFTIITVVVMILALVIAIILIIIVMLLLHLIYVPLQELIAIDPAVLHFPSSSMYSNEEAIKEANFFAGLPANMNQSMKPGGSSESEQSKQSSFKSKQSQIQSGFTCFDKNTMIELNNGSYKPICEITTYDILKNNNLVTSTFIGLRESTEMYCLDGVIVSGTHCVFYKGKIITVDKHPRSSKIDYNNDILYCINTSNKTIEINNNIFLDWDELLNSDIERLCKITQSNDKLEIHKQLESGFTEDTRVLIDNKYIPICDVKLGDNCGNSGKVIGLFKIKANDLKCIQKIKLKNKDVIIGSNIVTINSNLGDVCLRDSICEKLDSQPEFLYHILTTNGSLIIENCKFYDYRAGLEKLL